MGDSESTVPKVFIIESLEFKDEKKKLYEGHIISSILNLSKIESDYFYIRTKQESIQVVDLFYKSNYRYLHLSCHGGEDKNSIWTTLDEIYFDELGAILNGSLYNRRLFISACSVVNNDLAKIIIPQSQCYSIIGPAKDIEFRDATIMWSSLYHLMFKHNNTIMKRGVLKKNLQKVVDTFNQPFNYYGISESEGFNHVKIVAQT